MMTPEEMVMEIDDYGNGLTQWEISFIEDMLGKFEDARFEPTNNQVQKIEDIYEKRCQ